MRYKTNVKLNLLKVDITLTHYSVISKYILNQYKLNENC